MAMHKRTMTILSVLIALAMVSSTGCVTKKLFRKNVEETDARVAAAESGIEANERRIGSLREETDDKISRLDQKAERAVEVGSSAMARADLAAETAEKAARGRLIWSVTLSDERVKFSFDQAEIPDQAKSVLDDLISKIKGYGKAVYIEIEGHTDSTGTAAYNEELGMKRAMAVRDYLAKQGGLPLHAMNVISYGETQPVADNDTAEGRSKNRRVVVRVLE
jgi:outer membrane protein OmpA-like peptidoglycan-associated protein